MPPALTNSAIRPTTNQPSATGSITAPVETQLSMRQCGQAQRNKHGKVNMSLFNTGRVSLVLATMFKMAISIYRAITLLLVDGLMSS